MSATIPTLIGIILGLRYQTIGLSWCPMILIFVFWLVTLVICMTIGHMAMHVLSRWLPNNPSGQDSALFSYFLVGMSVITFYANLMSIVYRISFEFFGFLLFVTVTCIGLRYRTILKSVKRFNKTLQKLPSYIFIVIGYTILIALVSSSGMTPNLDEGGYYLSIVKWAEQYPLVSGTGLLNARIGYNSAFHMTSAVFGYEFLFSGGAYDLNGLLFVWLHVLGITSLWRLLSQKSSCFPADLLLAVSLIFPFRFLIDSMDVDYPSIVLGIYILSEYIRRIHDGHFFNPDIQLIGLTLISLFLFTVRPFSFVYLIPTIIVCCHQISKKVIKFPLIMALVCLCYVAPWLYRNVMISGYLIYPIHFVDLFSVGWKIPSDLAYNNYLLIKEFAKIELIRTDYLYTGVSDLPIKDWLRPWVENNWQLIVGKFVMLFIPIGILIHIITSFARSKRTSFWLMRNMLLLILILWFTSFPSIRFAWAFLLAFLVMVLYGMVQFNSKLRKLVVIGVLLAVVLSNIRTAYITYLNYSTNRILTPARTMTLEDYTLPKTNFQLLKSRTEYCHSAIPCMPHHNNYIIKLHGDKIEEGFRLKE